MSEQDFQQRAPQVGIGTRVNRVLEIQIKNHVMIDNFETKMPKIREIQNNVAQHC